MRFRLKYDWAKILQRAWSVRFMAAAILLTGFETGLPFLKELGLLEFLPGGAFAFLSCLVVMAALGSRLMVQNNLGENRGDRGERQREFEADEGSDGD